MKDNEATSQAELAPRKPLSAAAERALADAAHSGALPVDALHTMSADAAIASLTAVKGDTSKRAELIKAMETAKIDSPRGPFTFSKAHNPVQNIYLRKVEGRENKVIDTPEKSLADPARGCKL